MLTLAGCVAAPAPAPVGTPVVAQAPAPPRATVPRGDLPVTLDGTPRQGALLLGRAAPGTRALALDGVPVPLAADGRFVIGFDRDAAPTAVLTGRGSGETADWTAARRLSVAPGSWRIERINAPYRAGRTSAEFARLRPAELAQIASARAVQSSSSGWQQRFTWPVTGRVSGRFGAQRVYQGKPGSFHSGVDVAAAAGTPLRAPADGVVVLATPAPFTLEGNLVIVDHGMGLNSAFLHLSRIDVRVGQAVQQGEVIGAVGATGRATGPHMHWGMKWRDARIDPLPLAGAMPAGGGRPRPSPGL